MAKWSTAYINNLADKCFAYIEPGGKKDDEGKTVPRSLRHLPYIDDEGKIDAEHVRAALSYLDRTDISEEGRRIAFKRLKAAAKKVGVQVMEQFEEWMEKLAEVELLTPPDRPVFSEDELEMAVFRVGDYGAKGKYTEQDLDAIVSSYNDGGHEAPVTIDHADRGPAWGWVKGLKRAGDVLIARLGQLQGSFKEALKAGRYKKPSIELYSGPELRLRAVSFLGAQVPEVKGLPEAAFKEGESFLSIDLFEERRGEEMKNEEVKNQNEKGLKDFKEEDLLKDERVKKAIEAAKEEGAKAAKKEADAGKGEAEEMKQKFSEAQTKIAQLEAENRKQKREQVFTKLKREGKLLPAWEKGGLHEFCEALEAAGGTIKFKEGETEKEISPSEWFQKFLERMPEVVKMGEFSEAYKGGGDVEVVVGAGGKKTKVNADLHRKAVAFMEEKAAKGEKIEYAEALRAVSSKSP